MREGQRKVRVTEKGPVRVRITRDEPRWRVVFLWRESENRHRNNVRKPFADYTPYAHRSYAFAFTSIVLKFSVIRCKLFEI